MTNMASNLTFEDFKNQNERIYWWASEIMLMLGYSDMKMFKKVIDRAAKVFLSLNTDCYDNIIKVEHTVNGETITDYKLTRFACYIIAMNGDPKKPEVALAQTYFSTHTRLFELYAKEQSNIKLPLANKEITEKNKTFCVGADNYAKYTNAGFTVMYNMSDEQLANQRGVDQDQIFESMGRTELAANLFRITQTEERIKSQQIQEQQELEQTYLDIGREVRSIIERNTGRTPEQLTQPNRQSYENQI